MSVFEELGVCPELIQVADEQGWLLPTPVQAEAVGRIAKLDPSLKAPRFQSLMLKRMTVLST